MIKYFKLLLIFGCFVFPAALFANANTESSTTVQGKVCMEIHYDLENGCSPEATGLEGIMVSNQREVVLTDENGLRSEEHTSELQSRGHLVCRLLLEKKNIK